MLHLLKLQLDLRLLDPLGLPEYKGSTLRGAFGHVFKRVCCPYSYPCTGMACSLHQQCIYFQDFESLIRYGEASKRTVPHPFLIEPPLDSRLAFERGEILTLGLILIGKATEHFPYFLAAFEVMGGEGIGHPKGRFALEKVSSIRDEQAELVYQGKERRLCGSLLPIAFGDGVGTSRQGTRARRIEVTFLTPTQITQSGRVLYVSSSKPLGFVVFLRALFHRLSTLSRHHGDGMLDWDYTGLLERAQAICCELSDLTWKEYRRYSQRQERSEYLRGFVGQASYAGEGLEEFVPYVDMGRHLHVGNRTAFGLGLFGMKVE